MPLFPVPTRVHKRFKPFRRRDQPYGMRQWSQASLIAVTLLPLRVCVALLCMLGGWAVAASMPQGSTRRRILAFLARVCLFSCGFHYVERFRVGHKVKSPPTAVIVSNHVSWVDVLFHMSEGCPSFVAKKGVRDVPLVGKIAEIMQCVFVERERGTKGAGSMIQERQQVFYEAKEDLPPLVVFVEGTTSNGSTLLPFRTGAFVGGYPLTIKIIRYPFQSFDPAYETIDDLEHILKLLTQVYNRIQVLELPVYTPSSQEAEDPRLFADNVRKFMAQFLNVPLTDQTLQDKRAYHDLLLGRTKME